MDNENWEIFLIFSNFQGKIALKIEQFWVIRGLKSSNHKVTFMKSIEGSQITIL